MRTPILTLTLIATLTASLCASPAFAQSDPRTIVRLPGDDAFLINKTITLPERTERWTIEYRPGDSFIGNVTYEGTGETGFVYCEEIGVNTIDEVIEFQCQARSRGEAVWSDAGTLPIGYSFLGVGDVVSVPGQTAPADVENHCDLFRRRLNDITLRRWKACMVENIADEGLAAYSNCRFDALQKHESLSTQLRGYCFVSSEHVFRADATALIDTAAAIDKTYSGLGRVIFLTNLDYDGNLGGIEGADSKCQVEASNAGLPGEFKAWVSNETDDVSTRHAVTPTHFRLVDGTRIADQWSDLTDGSLQSAIVLDNFGFDKRNSFVWTGSKANGQNQSPSCNGFTTNDSGVNAVTGVPMATDARWSDGPLANCSQRGRLICIEQ